MYYGTTLSRTESIVPTIGSSRDPSTSPLEGWTGYKNGFDGHRASCDLINWIMFSLFSNVMFMCENCKTLMIYNKKGIFGNISVVSAVKALGLGLVEI